MERCIELTQGSGDSSFDLPALQSYLSMRPSAYRCHPRLFEGDCLHTPYLPPPPTHGHQSSSRSPALTATLPASRSSYALEGDLLGLDDNGDGNGDPPTNILVAKTKAEEGIDGILDAAGIGCAAAPQVQDELAWPGKRHRERRRGRRVRRGGMGPGRLCFRLRHGRDLGHDGAGGEAFPGDIVSGVEGCLDATWSAYSQPKCRKRFEIEKLSVEDVEMEDLNFYYASYSRCVARVFHCHCSS